MTIIKATTEKEAKLEILLHQSRQTADEMAGHIIRLARRLNRVTADKAKVERDMEAVIDRMQTAERELRRLNALRYTKNRNQEVIKCPPIMRRSL